MDALVPEVGWALEIDEACMRRAPSSWPEQGPVHVAKSMVGAVIVRDGAIVAEDSTGARGRRMPRSRRWTWPAIERGAVPST